MCQLNLSKTVILSVTYSWELMDLSPIVAAVWSVPFQEKAFCPQIQ